MDKKLTPEEIAGVAMLNFIIKQDLVDNILEKMEAINLLESISYETKDENKIEETYTRVLLLRGQRIYYSTKKYSYTESEKPTLQLNTKEPATIEDLKDFLIDSDYRDLLTIAKEVAVISAINKENTTLTLKK